jgi:hypothetical protein
MAYTADRDFQKAYKRAVAAYNGEEWLLLSPSEQTAMIYQRLREVDAERQGLLLKKSQSAEVMPAPMRIVAQRRTASGRG